jgi:hypothetical protein
MLKGNTQKIFRVVVGLVFLGVGVKNCMGGDWLFGFISLAAGAAFIVSLFHNKNGKGE